MGALQGIGTPAAYAPTPWGGPVLSGYPNPYAQSFPYAQSLPYAQSFTPQLVGGPLSGNPVATGFLGAYPQQQLIQTLQVAIQQVLQTVPVQLHQIQQLVQLLAQQQQQQQSHQLQHMQGLQPFQISPIGPTGWLAATQVGQPFTGQGGYVM